jgi:hypothetical protein
MAFAGFTSPAMVWWQGFVIVFIAGRVYKIKNKNLPLLIKSESFKFLWAVQIKPWQNPVISFMAADMDPAFATLSFDEILLGFDEI